MLRKVIFFPGMAGSSVMAQTVGTFTATGSMTEVRSLHTATLLLDGRVFLAGGYGAKGDLASAEVGDGSVIPPQVAIGGRPAEVLFFGNAAG